MKRLLFILLALTIFNCSNDDDTVESIDPTIFNSELSVMENLENGVAVLEITEQLGVQALYGIEYGGGFIFHVDETDGKDNWGWRSSCLDLLKRARTLVDEKNPKCEIAIDGGIRSENLAPLIACKPDVVVLSSAIFKDPEGITAGLKRCAKAIEEAQS